MKSSEVRMARITVLWAIHERYSTPHVVRAWSHSLMEAGYGLDDEICEAKEWMETWGDETGWTYWTTVESIPEPQGEPPWECEGCGSTTGRYDNGDACETCVMASFAEFG